MTSKIDHRIRYKQRMLSSGRCPLCGRKRSEHSVKCYWCLDKDAARKRRERMKSEDF